MNFERRFYPFRGEVRAAGDLRKGPELVGYAALFDVLTDEMFGFREKIRQGAFKDSIRTDDIRMLWNHDSNYVLARTKSGTLKLREDEKGLYFEAVPVDAQWARDLLASIKRGDVSQNSFGFFIQNEEWGKIGDSKVRTLTRIKLFDVSPVTYPAYPQTEVHIRGQGFETTIKDKRAIKKLMERFDAEYFEAEGLPLKRMR